MEVAPVLRARLYVHLRRLHRLRACATAFPAFFRVAGVRGDSVRARGVGAICTGSTSSDPPSSAVECGDCDCPKGPQNERGGARPWQASEATPKAGGRPCPMGCGSGGGGVHGWWGFVQRSSSSCGMMIRNFGDVCVCEPVFFPKGLSELGFSWPLGAIQGVHALAPGWAPSPLGACPRGATLRDPGGLPTT